MFPNDKGVTISNLEIEGHGKIGKGTFLNEQRLFGICKPKKEPEEVAEVKKRLKDIAADTNK